MVVYGEIKPVDTIKIGKKVRRGQNLGHVITVLKKDKGTPMTMLHLELYKSGVRETIIWNLDEPQPEVLLNPFNYLSES